MTVVVNHQCVADALGIQARTRGAKRPKTDRDIEDAIGTRSQRREKVRSIVRCEGLGFAVIRKDRSPAPAQAKTACDGERLQQPASRHVQFVRILVHACPAKLSGHCGVIATEK